MSLKLLSFAAVIPMSKERPLNFRVIIRFMVSPLFSEPLNPNPEISYTGGKSCLSKTMTGRPQNRAK
jgi:hypothetical protein